MPTLLIVHHTTSPALEELLTAVLAGARTDELTDVTVEVRPALSATVPDVLAADGFVLGTPANIGYMSGALKHFFDQIYYPCLDATRGRPYAVYVHGDNDATGALLAIEKITTGLRWQLAQQPLTVLGRPTTGDLEASWELGAALAAHLS